jgi:capsular exopolysaccharide synthesis family protein
VRAALNEIDLKNFKMTYLLQDIRKRLFLIISVALMAAMATFVLRNETYVATYTSEITFSVSTQGSINDAYSNMSTTTKMTEMITQLLDSNAFESLVCEELGLKEIPGGVAASQITNTNFITISVTSDSPIMAFRTVKTIMKKLGEISDLLVLNAIIDIFTDAVVPETADESSKIYIYCIIGFILGAAIVIAWITYKSLTTDAIRSIEALQANVDGSILCTIPYEKNSIYKRRKNKKEKGLLISDLRRSFVYVESFKRLRAKVEQYASSKGHKVFLVTSLLMNEGKTIVAANLAISLAKNQHDVLFIDADMRKPYVYKLFDKKPESNAEVTDILLGRTKRLYVHRDALTGVNLILGSKSYEKSDELLGSTQMATLIAQAKQKYDFIIIDTPPVGMLSDAEVAAEAFADASIMIVRENYASYPAINRAIASLSDCKAEYLGCVYNMYINQNTQQTADSYGIANHYDREYAAVSSIPHAANTGINK